MANDIIVLDENINPIDIFKTEKVDDFLDKIIKEARANFFDISTEKGRKDLASYAYKIARTKTTLDDMGKDLVSGWKEQAAKVDIERKKIRDTLDNLKDEIRKPLTDWENAEKERVYLREQRIADIYSILSPLPINPEIAGIENAILSLENLSHFEWQEFALRAEKASQDVKEKLLKLKQEREKYDAEQAELERLRQEQIKREQKEREERIAAEAAAKAKADAEEAAAEAARVAQEKADKERKEIEAKAEAERKAKEDAERRVKEAELAKAEAAKQAEIEKKLAAEAAAKAERVRIMAEEKAKADELEKREKDKAHKAKIHNEALAVLKDIVEDGGDIAKNIIVAIAKNEIPNVKIVY